MRMKRESKKLSWKSLLLLLCILYDQEFLIGAVMQWLRVRIHNTGVVSSNPARVTIPLVTKATGNTS